MKKLICVMLFSMTSLFVFGQDEIPLSDSLTKELVITHSKQPISILNTHKPIDVISSEEIKRYGIDDVSSLLDSRVGLSVVGSRSNFGKDKSLFLQGASGEFTLILIDGSPLTDPSGIGSSFDLRSISLSGIERIEILKGGQSGLYGTDAIAGVVNLITSTDANDEISGSLKAGYGSYNTREVSGSLNLPLAQGLSASLSVGTFGTDGISEALDEQGVGFDEDGLTRHTGTARITWKPNDELKVSPYYKTSFFEGDFDGGSFFDSEDTYETDFSSFGLNTSYDIGEGKIVAHLGRVITDRTFNTAFGAFAFRGRYLDLDIHGYKQIGDDLTLTVGLHRQGHNVLDSTTTIVNPDITIWSPYTQIDYSVTESTHLHGGLRFNDHSTFGSNLNFSLGASNWFSDQVKGYVSYATSYRAPNLFQLFGSFGANPDLTPQEGRTINLGIEAHDLGVLSKIALNLFDRSVKDLIVFEGGAFANVPNQNDMGLDLSTNWMIGSVRLNTSYTYLFGELDDQVNDPSENLLRRPNHQFDLGLGVKPWKSGNIDFNLRYTGDRNDAFFDNLTFATEAVILDAYWLSDLVVGHQVSSLDLYISLSLRNLFDESYEEIAGFATQGRNFMLSVSKDF